MNLKNSIKVSSYTTFFLLAVLVVSQFGMQTSSAQYVAENHCNDPKESRTIIAAPSGNDTELSFDKDVLDVPKNTCIEIRFINKAPTVEHDFVIDFVPGDEGINFVDIHLLNNTDGPYNNGTDIFNIKTPDEDVSFDYYCSIGNHREKGMEGTLKVGEGSSEGFLNSTPFVVIGITLMVATVILRKRTK